MTSPTTVTLPKDPSQKPKNDGSGGTWNFQLRPTFWFGLTLCDTESAPEFTKTCTPDSDANALEGLDPTAARLHGQASGQRVHGAPVLRTGLRPAVRGLRLQREAVLRRDDDRQPHHQHEQRTSATTRTAATTSSVATSRSTGRTSPRAAQSQAPANPLFTGTFDSFNPAAVNPDYNKDLMMNPGDRITIHMHDTTRRPPDRHQRPDHPPERVDDRVDRERVRAHPVRARLQDVHDGAVRLPSRVRHRQPAWQHVVGAHVQRRVLG